MSKDGQPQSIGGFSVPARAAVGVPFVVSAQAKSGLAVSFRAGPAEVRSGTAPGCTVSGATLIPLTAGPCTVTAFQAGSFQPPSLSGPAQKAVGPQHNLGYQAAVPATRSIQVQRAQTIWFTQPGSALAGVAVPLTATASSGLPVSFRSGTPAVCTVSGSTVTPLAAGMCAITATQDGNSDYAAATDITRSFRVKATQSITFTQPGSAAAGVTVPLSATASSGLPVSFRSATPGVCTVTGKTARTLAAGTCIIAATQGGSAAFAPAPDMARSLTVHAGTRPQTIRFRQPPPTVAGRPVVLFARATSQLPVSLRSDTRPVCTVSGTTVTALAAGMCTITASQGGNATFRSAPDVARSLEIQAGPRPQEIHFRAPSATRAGARVSLIATASSGLPVAFRSGSLPVCTVSGTTATAPVAGMCTIIASQGGDTVYAAAQDVTQSFRILAGQQAQTITFTPPPASPVGVPVTLTASASSGLPVSFGSGTPAVCSVSGATVTTLTPGTCSITATQGGSTTYAAARETRSLAVQAGHRAQWISFGIPPAATVGQPVILTASASSGLPVSFWSGTPAVCSVSGATVTTLTPGTCSIAATQGGSTTYAAARPAGWSFPVSPAAPAISGVLLGSLAAAALAAAGGALALQRRRLLRLRGHPPAAGPSVRAAANPGPPGSASTRATGAAAAHTVRINAHPGASTTTIKESPHGSSIAGPPGDRP